MMRLLSRRVALSLCAIAVSATSALGQGYFGRKDRKSTRLNSSHANISYAVFCLISPPPLSTLFPYTTLFRSRILRVGWFYKCSVVRSSRKTLSLRQDRGTFHDATPFAPGSPFALRHRRVGHLRPGPGILRPQRSEEHTSELQSRQYLVCRLLLDLATSAIYTLSLHDALPISYLAGRVVLQMQCR